LGMIINIEENEKLILQVLYRRITRFSDGIQKLEIWDPSGYQRFCLLPVNINNLLCANITTNIIYRWRPTSQQ
jgi:hypothetical protein